MPSPNTGTEWPQLPPEWNPLRTKRWTLEQTSLFKALPGFTPALEEAGLSVEGRLLRRGLLPTCECYHGNRT